MALNFKGVPYTTTWLEYPDIAPTLSSKGIPAQAGMFPYSCPTAQFPDGNYVVDSLEIAKTLDKLYPEKPMYIDSDTVKEVQEQFPKMWGALSPAIFVQVPRNLLNPPSAEYFERTRHERFGMSLAEYDAQQGGDKAWQKAEPEIKNMAVLLKKNGGPFFMGKTREFC